MTPELDSGSGFGMTFLGQSANIHQTQRTPRKHSGLGTAHRLGIPKSPDVTSGDPDIFGTFGTDPIWHISFGGNELNASILYLTEESPRTTAPYPHPLPSIKPCSFSCLSPEFIRLFTGCSLIGQCRLNDTIIHNHLARRFPPLLGPRIVFTEAGDNTLSESVHHS